MATFRVFFGDDSKDHEFEGSIHQFVRVYGKGRGMPDGERVAEVPSPSVKEESVEAPVAAPKPKVVKSIKTKG